MQPVRPVGTGEERGQDFHRQQRKGQGGQQEQRRSKAHHAGSIVPGKAGDKSLAGGLFLAGLLHQLQNAGDGGLAAGLGDPQTQRAALVDEAAEDLVPGRHVAGKGLAGEGGGIQGGRALQHHPVQGDFLSRLDHNHVADGHFLGGHLLQRAVPLQVGIVGPDVHEGGDGLAGAGDGVVLEQLAHLVKEHDEHGLGVFAGEKGAHGGKSHEEVLVKHLAPADAAHRLAQYVQADDGIGDQIDGPQKKRVPCRRLRAGEQGQRTVKVYGGQQLDAHQQRRGKEDAPEGAPLGTGELMHGKDLL